MGTTNNSVFIDSKTFSLRELFTDKSQWTFSSVSTYGDGNKLKI